MKNLRRAVKLLAMGMSNTLYLQEFLLFNFQ